MDHEDLAKVLDDLRLSVEGDIVQDSTMPSATLDLFKLHWEKPWTPDFLTSLVAPLRPTLRSYLKLSILRAHDRVWYVPSANWWRAHVLEAHPPDGSGCDVERHVQKYTDIGEKGYFMYADVMRDGRLRVLGEEDFKAEAEFWKEHWKPA